MKRGSLRFFVSGIFVLLVVVLGLWFVKASITAPGNPTFSNNATSVYDEGSFFVNWTASNATGNETLANYSIYIFANNTFYLKATNDSTTGYTFSNTTQANYTFIIEAVNKTGTGANANSTNSSIFVDSTKPSLTATCDPTSLFSGSSFPCSCSAATDADSGVSGSVTSSSTSDTTTDTNIAGSFTFTCTAKDVVGNTGTSTADYTVLQSGGGLPVTPQPKLPKQSHSFDRITPGAAAIMTNFDSQIGIKEITINVNNPAQNVKITVTKHTGQPAEVSVAKSGKVYQYLQIDAQNLGASLDNAAVEFRVEKSWVSGNNVQRDRVAVFRYNEAANTWNEMTTTFSSEDATYYYYDVSLDSFSYFAISESEARAPGAVPRLFDEEGGISVWVWIVLVIIVLAVVGYSMRRKKK